MKKYLALFLALLMAISLFSACSSAPKAEAPAEKPAEAAPAEEAAAEDDFEKYDEITIQTATSFNANEFSGQLVEWFGNYLEEKSGGRVTFDCYYGGSFCSDAEVYDYLMDDTLNLSFVQPAYFMSYMPYSFGLASWISDENAVEVCNNLLYENEETATLIQDQAANFNMHVLGHTSAGASLFLTSGGEVTSMADCTKYTIGSPINLELYQDYGFGTVAIEPADMYDSLSRGVCDMIAYSAPNIVTSNLLEVANNVGDVRAYFTNQVITVSKTLWDSMNEDTQQLFIEAAQAVAEYSYEVVDDLWDELMTDVDECGGTYNLFPEEDGKEFNYRSMQSTANMLRMFAENAGCADGMEVILAAWAEGLEQEPF